jgi:hypothetical protein
MAKAAKTKDLPKSAITGRIVTKEYADTHKKTTVVLKVPVTTKKK